MLKIFSSKIPIKYTDCPLNIAIDVQIKTNTKLNLYLEGQPLIPKEEEKECEYHLLRFEGHISTF
jgi:hypothetical protein